MISLRAFDRPHSEISPSNFERISSCTMSHQLAAGRFGRPVASQDAALGTAAHTLLEWCLKTDSEPGQVESVAVEGRPFRVDARMKDAVQVAVDWVRAELAGRPLLIEHRVSFPWSGLTGWVDIATADEPLVVVDFKHGYGLVGADSPQLGLYALGILLERGHAIDGEGTARAVIIQPRASADPIRAHTWSFAALRELLARLIDTVIKIKRGQLGYSEGPWCRFCPVASTCPHLRAVARDYAASTLAVPELVAAGELGAEQLDAALAMAPGVRATRTTAEDYLLAGGKLTSHKLVAARTGLTVAPRTDPRPEVSGLPTLRAALRSSLALELLPDTEPARGSGPVQPRREASLPTDG